MRRNLIIVILIIVSAVSLIYGFRQQSSVRQMGAKISALEMEVIKQKDLANKSAEEARRQQMMSELNALEAKRQNQRAEEELKRCAGRMKK